jgi:hypothetical protein
MKRGVLPMAKTKYVIELTEEEKEKLINLVSNPETPEKVALKANILLTSDIHNEKKLSVPEVAELFGTTHTTVQTTRRLYGTQGLDAALVRKKRAKETKERTVHRTDYHKSPSKMTDDVVEKILALSKTEPPEGKKRWTVRSLADKCVELGIVDQVAPSTISLVLKKAGISTK